MKHRKMLIQHYSRWLGINAFKHYNISRSLLSVVSNNAGIRKDMALVMLSYLEVSQAEQKDTSTDKPILNHPKNISEKGY